MARLNLPQDIETRDGAIGLPKDSKLVNCYVEKMSADRIAVQKRMGTTLQASFNPSSGQGMFTLNNVAYAIFGDKISLLNSPFTQTLIIAGTASFTGAISGTGLTVSVVTGTIQIGQIVTGAGVTANTVIVSGSGTSWVVNNFQTVGSEAMTSAAYFFPNQIYDFLAEPISSTTVNTTYSITATITSPVSTIYGIAFDSINNAMYICNNMSNVVYVINCTTNSITHTITVGNIPQSAACAVISGVPYIYIGNFADSTVSVINGNTFAVTATISAYKPYCIAYCLTNNTMYVGSLNGNSVQVINCATNTVTAIILIPGGVSSIAWDSVFNQIYVSVGTVNIYVIPCSGGSANTIVYTIVAPNAVTGIGYNASGYLYCTSSVHFIYVVTCASGAGSVTASISVANSYFWPTYNPDKNIMYIGGYNPSNGQYVLDTIDCASNTIKTGLVITYFSCPGSYNNTNKTFYLPLGNTVIDVISSVQVSVTSSYIAFKSQYGLWTFDGTTVKKVTDVNYPSNQTTPLSTVPGFVFLDGYYFVLTTTGILQNSAIPLAGNGDVTTWPPLSYLRTTEILGAPVALAYHLNYVIALGSLSIQGYYDAGNNYPGSPLGIATNVFFNIGCANGRSVVEIDDMLIFISTAKQRGRSLMALSGLSLQNLSNSHINKILNNDPLTSVYAYGIKLWGHDFYILTLVLSNITLAYDITNGNFSVWTSTKLSASQSVSLTSVDGILVTATVTSHGFSDGDVVVIAGAVSAPYNGSYNITYIDPNTFTYQITGGTPLAGSLMLLNNLGQTLTASNQTGGVLIVMNSGAITATATGYSEGMFSGAFYTATTDGDYVQDISDGSAYVFGQNYADADGYINTLIRTQEKDLETNDRKFCRNVQVIGDTVATNALLRYSNDDYQTYSTYQVADMSTQKKQIPRQGSFIHRSYDIRHTDNAAFRVSELDLDIS